MVTNEGYKQILNLLNSNNTVVTEVKVGFSDNVEPESLDDTAEKWQQSSNHDFILVSTQDIKSEGAVTRYPFVMNGAFLAGKRISDAALFINGKLISRKVLDTPIEKTEAMSYTGEYSIEALRNNITILELGDSVTQIDTEGNRVKL